MAFFFRRSLRSSLVEDCAEDEKSKEYIKSSSSLEEIGSIIDEEAESGEEEDTLGSIKEPKTKSDERKDIKIEDRQENLEETPEAKQEEKSCIKNFGERMPPQGSSKTTSSVIPFCSLPPKPRYRGTLSSLGEVSGSGKEVSLKILRKTDGSDPDKESTSSSNKVVDDAERSLHLTPLLYQKMPEDHRNEPSEKEQPPNKGDSSSEGSFFLCWDIFLEYFFFLWHSAKMWVVQKIGKRSEKEN